MGANAGRTLREKRKGARRKGARRKGQEERVQVGYEECRNDENSFRV